MPDSTKPARTHQSFGNIQAIHLPTEGGHIMIMKSLVLGISSGAKDAGGIPAEKVAEMLHSVIESNRTFYMQHVVERMQAKGAAVASENWRSEKTLPLLASPILTGKRSSIGQFKAKVGYKLVSLWPSTSRMGQNPKLRTGA
jgi:hypothetical protein